MKSCSTLFSILAAITLTATACTDDTSEPGDDMMEPGDDPGDEPGDEPDPVESPAAGELYTSFGDNGMVTLPGATGVAIEKQGDKLVLCMNVQGTRRSVRVVRMSKTGELDMTFGTEGRLAIGHDTAEVLCSDMKVLSDGRIAVTANNFDAGPTTIAYTADGEVTGDMLTASAITSKLSSLKTQPGFVGTNTQGFKITTVLAAGGAATSTPSNSNAVEVAAVVLDDNDNRYYVARDAGWQIKVKQQASEALESIGNGATVEEGSQQTSDSLKGAFMLPDGSIFAWGGVDGIEKAMAVRWVLGSSPIVDVETHGPAGTYSVAHGATLDAMNRPVVVGSQKDPMTGLAKFQIQRYEANSVTLDTSYQADGVKVFGPESSVTGLADIVELDGALYAIGSMTANNEYHAVVLKIAE